MFTSLPRYSLCHASAMFTEFNQPKNICLVKSEHCRKTPNHLTEIMQKRRVAHAALAMGLTASVGLLSGKVS